MSDQNVSAFFDSAKADSALQQRIKSVTGDSLPAIAATLAALSRETSTPFTAEEFLARAQPLSDADLSDQELADVAGGFQYYMTINGKKILFNHG